tara:strand:- start:1267 stop:1488 length:222 start_codon:yes stop_codon:yes gene_type:complete
MGGKAPMQSPPAALPTDVQDASAKAEAKVEKERQAMIGGKKKGMYGTILTGGTGVEDEVSTAKTMLGSGKPIS